MRTHPARNRPPAVAAILATLLSPAFAHAADLSAADRVAAFKAADAKQQGGRWVICTDDPQTSGASIEDIRDLNGDGRPEAVVVEDGTFCNGASGARFALVSQQADGGWRSMLASEGMAEVLSPKGKDGWPDVAIGGPGFCFPVMRWNGNAYVFNRNEYEGKRCKP